MEEPVSIRKHLLQPALYPLIGHLLYFSRGCRAVGFAQNLPVGTVNAE